MEIFIQNIGLTVLFPLWCSVLIFLGNFLSILKSKKIILSLTLLSTTFGLITSLFTFFNAMVTENFVLENTFKFLSVNNFILELGTYIDLTSSFMLLIIFTVTLAVQIYSYSYMYNDASFSRFFALMNFFTFSMSALVLSPNLFQIYICWELVGVSSYLLISFWFHKNAASNAGKKAFVMNRIGDMCLLAGIILSSIIIYNYSGQTDFADIPFSSIDKIAAYLFTYTSEPIFIIICVLLILGSIAKSAQFPLHTWLPDAMEGPTPVSALIHSATMVAAGVFLIARLFPIYYQSSFVMNFIVIIGIISALIGAFCAITCRDIKRILAYSTSSQLGIMFIALGSGALTASMLYLATHAFIKSMLFLCAGLIMSLYLGKTDIDNFGGLKKHMSLIAYIFLIGAFSLSGILFSGFASKSLVFHHLFETHSYYIILSLLVISFMTAFYIFRMYFLVFEGNSHTSDNKKYSHVMVVPILFLCVITLLLGFFLPKMSTLKYELIPVTTELVAILLAYLFYVKFVNMLPKLPILYNLSYNKLYIDNFYDFITQKLYLGICKTANFIDDYIFDGTVFVTVFLTKLNAWLNSKFQTGSVQSYISYSFAILALVLTGFCLVYSLVAYFAEV